MCSSTRCRPGSGLGRDCRPEQAQRRVETWRRQRRAPTSSGVVGPSEAAATRCARHVVEEQPAGLERGCRSGARAHGRGTRLVVVTFRRTSAPPEQDDLDLVNGEAELVQAPQAAPDRVASRPGASAPVELAPDRVVALADVLGGVDAPSRSSGRPWSIATSASPYRRFRRGSRRRMPAVLPRATVGTRSLGVDQVRLDAIAVAPEERVRERAVAQKTRRGEGRRGARPWRRGVDRGRRRAPAGTVTGAAGLERALRYR